MELQGEVLSRLCSQVFVKSVEVSRSGVQIGWLDKREKRKNFLERSN